MKVVKKLLAAGVLVACVAYSHAETLRIYTCDEPPLNFMESGAPGEVTGVSCDVVREILKRTGHDGQIELVPWARGYRYAQTEPNVFLFSMSRTDQREQLFEWVGPLAAKKSVLLARKDSDIRVEKLEDAKQLGSIGTMIEDAKEQYLIRHGFENLVRVSDWEQGVKMLLSGRIDLLTMTDLDLPAIVHRAGLEDALMKPVYTLYDHHLYIGVSKTTPAGLVREWQTALKEIQADGTFAAIVEKWAAHYGVTNWKLRNGCLQIIYE